MTKVKSMKEEYPAESRRPYIDAAGREVGDPTPMAPPVGYQRPMHLWDQMREMMRQERLLADQAEPESFEEADDFDVGDDYDPTSPHEEVFEPVPVRELKRRFLADAEEARRRAQEAPPASPDGSPSPPPADPPSDGPKPSPTSQNMDGRGA